MVVPNAEDGKTRDRVAWDGIAKDENRQHGDACSGMKKDMGTQGMD